MAKRTVSVRWGQLPNGMARRLERATGGSPSRFNEQFVRDYKAEVIDCWLARDQQSRSALVAALWDANIGPGMRRPRSTNGELRYLHDCRNSGSFRRLLMEQVRVVAAPKPTRPKTPPDGDDEVSTITYETLRVIERSADAEDRFRPYVHQTEAWQALDRCAPVRGGLLVLPTGGGKTVTAVRWLHRTVLSGQQPRNVLWLAHRAELLEQAARTFVDQIAAADRQEPLRIRCISGSHGARASLLLSDEHVHCATVQSLAADPGAVDEYLQAHPDAFVVIDEAHHAAAATYREIVKKVLRRKHTGLLGLTATPTRTAEEELGALNRCFPQGVVYQVSAEQLLSTSVLARPVCETVDTHQNFESDLTAAEKQYLGRFGELSPRTLARIGRNAERNNHIVGRYLAFREHYGQTLVFCSSVEQCHMLVGELRERGVPSEYVTSFGQHQLDEARALEAFRNNKINILATVVKLTEGYDIANVQTVFLARPTGSHILLNQMVGRGMRGPSVVSGTTEVRIVSFDDHWERFSSWLDPIEFLASDIAIDPESPTVERREHLDVPWDLYLEVQRLRRRDVLADDRIATAVGWFDLRGRLDETPGVRRHVLVYRDQVDGYDDLFERFEAASGANLDQAVEECFGDDPPPQPTIETLVQLATYWDQTGERPPLVKFEHVDEIAPFEVASRCRSEGLDIDAEIERLYETPTARLLYADQNEYAHGVYEAVAALKYGDRGYNEEVRQFDLRKLRKELPPGQWVGKLRELVQEVRREHGLRRRLPRDFEVLFSKRVLRSYWAIYQPDPTRIVVNRVMNTSAITRETLKFLLYHELLHHELGVAEGHSREFRRRERLYPQWRRHDNAMDTLCERYLLGGGPGESRP